LGAPGPARRGQGIGSRLVEATIARRRGWSHVQSNEYDAYFVAAGRREAFVAKVGTRREHCRGLASLLLRHALVRYRDAGYGEASLDVDSENPTGALGISERAGFEAESRWTNYVLLRKPLTR
jgi:mycothiol synthase